MVLESSYMENYSHVVFKQQFLEEAILRLSPQNRVCRTEAIKVKHTALLAIFLNS